MPHKRRLTLVDGVALGLLFALAFAPIGLVIVWRRWSQAGLLLGSYLLLNYLAIGSATRGFERYLSPLLPVLYLLAAIGIEEVVVRGACFDCV